MQTFPLELCGLPAFNRRSGNVFHGYIKDHLQEKTICELFISNRYLFAVLSCLVRRCCSCLLQKKQKESKRQIQLGIQNICIDGLLFWCRNVEGWPLFRLCDSCLSFLQAVDNITFLIKSHSTLFHLLGHNVSSGSHRSTHRRWLWPGELGDDGHFVIRIHWMMVTINMYNVNENLFLSH